MANLASPLVTGRGRGAVLRRGADVLRMGPRAERRGSERCGCTRSSERCTCRRTARVDGVNDSPTDIGCTAHERAGRDRPERRSRDGNH